MKSKFFKKLFNHIHPILFVLSILFGLNFSDFFETDYEKCRQRHGSNPESCFKAIDKKDIEKWNLKQELLKKQREN